MRVFHIKLEKSDFESTAGGRWLSPIIDLYDNDWYTNFSTVKSNYGLNTEGNFTWVGMLREAIGSWLQFRYLTWAEVADRTWRSEEGLNTDSGRVYDGRFIDTSAQVNLVSFSVSVENNAYSTVTPTLDVYTSEFQNAIFSDEWTSLTSLTTADQLDYESPQYARFALNFEADPGVDYDATLWIRVEIGRPVMAPLYNETKNILDVFPKWTAIREIDNTQHATPELATPVSLGGKLINAISGEWLDDVNRNLTYLDLQHYIDTVDLTQKAWVYKSSRVPEKLHSVVGDDIRVGQAVDQRELLEALDDEHVYWWDEDTDTLYFSHEYTTLLLNGVSYVQEPHHVWNYLDEIGLSVDLFRLLLEGNDSFKKRIQDVYKNLPGVAKDAFKLALRRELNMWKYEGATPDSDFLGATPTVLEMSDVETDEDYIDPDGMPTERFNSLVDKLSRQYPTTWGRFRWDKAVWDVGGADHSGYTILPYRMDATPLTDTDTQSGIGDGNDLYVFRPEVITGPRNFTAKLKVRGRQRASQTQYPPVRLEFEIYGQADRKIYNNPTNDVWNSVEIITYDPAATTYIASFLQSSKSNVDVDRATTSPSTYAVQDIFSMDDRTHTSLSFVNKTTGAAYVGPGATPSTDGRIPGWNISSMTLKHGKWNVGSQTYTDKEGSDTFSAWYSHTTGTPELLWNTASGWPVVIGSALDPKVLPRPSVVLKSKQTSFSVGKWTSNPVKYAVTLNNVSPNTASNTVTVNMPNIAWDNFLEATPNKEFVMRLTMNNGNATPSLWGGVSTTALGDPIFLPANPYIRVNANATWTSDRTKTFAGNTTSVALTTGSGALYPISGYSWTLFESSQIGSIAGVVDENGPWRNGIAPNEGNTNFTLTTISVDRDDFGIPNNANYVPTWMGIEIIDDSRVLAWLDSNTIEPAVDDGVNVVYPDTAIKEEFVSGSYAFEPFVVRAKLRPNVGPEWYPQVHSGYFYDHQDEHYLYAKPVEETVTSATPLLSGVARQGAPIIVKTNEATPKEFRQVAFYNDATPTTLTHMNKERLKGNGTTSLYLAYPNVYNLTVTDLTTGAVVGLTSTSTLTNVATTTVATNKAHTYEVTYELLNSFFADNDYESATPTATNYTQLYFDRSPAQAGVASYKVTYESSIFDPATPVDLPLSPLFTTQDEGFIFLSHEEFDWGRLQVYLSPSKLVADGIDYLLITLRSFDTFGNPKGFQTFNLATTFGTLSSSSVVTDRDGSATVVLTAAVGTASLTGNVTVTGPVGDPGTPVVVPFDIEPIPIPEYPYHLTAVVSAEQIPSDGRSQVIIYGRVEDEDYNPIAQAKVRWKRARSMYELFTAGGTTTTVTANAQGVFTIGPLTAQNATNSGYWFMSLESDEAVGGATWETVGDVVFWQEYPDSIDGVENMTGLPRPPIQMATPIGTIPPYAVLPVFPSYYDEATPYAPATPATILWLPPKWYAMKKYRQYQLGIFGTVRGTINIALYNQIHRSRRQR